MIAGDIISAGKVGNGAGDSQNAIVRLFKRRGRRQKTEKSFAVYVEKNKVIKILVKLPGWFQCPGTAEPDVKARL